MASKTISVTKEVYELLARLKLPHESFGDVIRRLCEEKTARSVVEWANQRLLWADMSKTEYHQIQDNIKATRRQFHIQEVDVD
ncbi:MAG: antitoxin VapB family protein [Candidatus Heimdallarchaeota archaeon]